MSQKSQCKCPECPEKEHCIKLLNKSLAFLGHPEENTYTIDDGEPIPFREAKE